MHRDGTVGVLNQKVQGLFFSFFGIEKGKSSKGRIRCIREDGCPPKKKKKKKKKKRRRWKTTSEEVTVSY